VAMVLLTQVAFTK